METTAEMHGHRWGARAEARAALFADMSRPAWEVIASTITSGMTVLDIGCGSGEFCRIAAARGADTSGIDAAESAIAIARRNLPDGDFRVGAMEALPWPDKTFDLVTGFNAFHMAADFDVALWEAKRVARGRVVLCNWTGYNEVLSVGAEILPLQPPDWAPRPQPAVADPGVLEDRCARAGLTVTSTGVVDVPWEAPDQDTVVRALLTTGSYHPAIEYSGEAAVGAAIIEGAEPFRRTDGSYRFENRFRYVIARI